MKAIAIAIALAASTAAAQPKPAHPKPAPKQPPAAPLAPLDDPDTAPPPAPVPAPQPNPVKPTKVNPNDTLQNGSNARPWAVGVSQSEQQAALALFHDGNTELNDGLFAKAADKYEAALKHWDHPAIHYNLGIALMNLDKTIDAYNDFESSMKYGDAALPKGSYESAKNYLVVLGHAIGELWVSCNKPGAKVSVDGKLVFTAPGMFKSKVKIGRHSIVAELEGHPTRVTAPDIEPGSPYKMELTLYTVKELTRYKHKWHALWMPYTVLGAGVVVGVVGGLMEFHASNKYKDYDNEVAKCAPSCTNSQSLKDIRNTGDTYKTAGFVVYGVGAAVAVTGAILAIVNRSVAYQVRPEDLGTEPTVRVQPVISPSFAGAALSGRF